MAARCSRVLKELIPGAQHWPRFLRNRSEQFEARLSLVEIARFALDAAGGHARLAPAGGGRHMARAGRSSRARRISAVPGAARLVAFRYHRPTTASRQLAIRPIPTARCMRIAALTTPDGRVTVTMPHPERVYRTVQNSWHAARCRRGQRLDAPVPQRPRVARLKPQPGSVERSGERLPCSAAAGGRSA